MAIAKKNFERDRRSSHRHSVKTALRVRVWNSGQPEHRAESVNVSLRGIYFNTKTPLCEGEIVEVLLKMPEEVSGEQTTEWRCTGHVVRVEPFDATKGKLGVGCNSIATKRRARSRRRCRWRPDHRGAGVPMESRDMQRGARA